MPDRYVVYDSNGNVLVDRLMTEEEQSAYDAYIFQQQYKTAEAQYLEDLRNGIPALIAARNEAQADANAMDAQILDTIAKRDAVQAFVVPATYSAATITAIKNELVSIRNFQISQLQYRKAVDLNAVTTDNALIWVGKVLGETVLEE